MKRILPVLAAVLMSACAQQHVMSSDEPLESGEVSHVQSAASESGSARYGRYTLVSTAPSADQVNLLSQVVDTRIPASMNPTVREALDHVMLRTGYALCPPPAPEVETLYTRPLPAAHYRIGPTSLRNALQLLAGSAYAVEVNEISRMVCFTVKPGFMASMPPAEKESAE